MDVTAAQVKARASELGFDLCGIARAHPLAPERLDHWLSRGWDAGLAYVRDRREERLDPGRLVEGARSVIVVAATTTTWCSSRCASSLPGCAPAAPPSTPRWTPAR